MMVAMLKHAADLCSHAMSPEALEVAILHATMPG